MTAEHPFTKEPIDLSAYAFVDDIFRILPLDHASEATIVSNYDSVVLTTSLDSKEYSQNKAKAEIISYLASHIEQKRFLRDERVIDDH